MSGAVYAPGMFDLGAGVVTGLVTFVVVLVVAAVLTALAARKVRPGRQWAVWAIGMLIGLVLALQSLLYLTVGYTIF